MHIECVYHILSAIQTWPFLTLNKYLILLCLCLDRGGWNRFLVDPWENIAMSSLKFLVHSSARFLSPRLVFPSPLYETAVLVKTGRRGVLWMFQGHHMEGSEGYLLEKASL